MALTANKHWGQLNPERLPRRWGLGGAL